MSTGLCPYCAQEKELTDEHILPRALGGALQPTNPFKVPACKRCNNLCGKYVDAPFIRDWHVYNARSLAGQQFFEKGSEPIAPLLFMGEHPGWDDSRTRCDFWLGPTGDHIYHFHEPYEQISTMVGRPVAHKDEMDPGVVHVAFVGTNPVWPPIVYRSILDAFPGAAVHFINADPQRPMGADERAQSEWVKAIPPTSKRRMRISSDLHLGERFMVKVALGFGAKHLASGFLDSPDAALLRAGLWEQDRGKRDALEIRGVSVWGSKGSQLAKLFAWHHCHLIWAAGVDDALALRLHLYSKYEMQIQVTNQRKHWEGLIHEGEAGGTLWVIQPTLRRFAGSMPLSAFVAHKEHSTGPLADLKSHIDRATPFPPSHLPISNTPDELDQGPAEQEPDEAG